MTALRRCTRSLPALIVGLCAAAAAASINAAEVWVVTDSQHPVKAPPGVRITELDAARRIEAHIAKALPPHPSQAAAHATRRLSELTQALASAYQGIVDAWSVGVTKVPAVIVDRRYIVYGEHDVERAMRDIERYRRLRE